MFYKETIMGQVLTQVKNNKQNNVYFDQIDDLLYDIEQLSYLDTIVKPWQKNGLIITDVDISYIDNKPKWVYVETADVSEYSWLIEQLIKIYQPKINDIYRLLTTLGFLLNIYSEKYDSLSDVLRLTSITSTVFLHPDHLGFDKFKVYPTKLPPFGKEF